MTFCPLCETTHDPDGPCSIRGLTAVKSRGVVAKQERSGLQNRHESGQHGPTPPKPSKDELRAIIAQLETEKAERRKRKAAAQKRWRYKRAGK